MKKIGLIAAHEFQASVTSKGFVIGLLIMPTIFAIAFIVGPRFINQSGPPIRGEVAVIDPTGRVADVLAPALEPRAIAARRTAASRAVLQAQAGDAANEVGNDAINRSIGQIPELHLISHAGAQLDSEKAWLNETASGLRH